MSRSADPTVSLRLAEARKAHARGWLLTPLRGKRPYLKGWQAAPAPDLSTVEEWARSANIGLRTGSASGVVVLDDDSADGSGLAALDLPPTPTVITGSGKRHAYFAAPVGGLGNSVRKLPAVDVRADGGQVVYVGSIHPDTGQPYRWAEGLSPDEVPLAPFPAALLDRLTTTPETSSMIEVFPGEFPQRKRRPAPGGASSSGAVSPTRQRRRADYSDKALERMCGEVRGAEVGQRNSTLNRAAFAAGQFVGAGSIEQEQATLRLLDAAGGHMGTEGFDTAEAERTIRSGLDAGMKNPRDLSHVGPRKFEGRAPDDRRSDVRVPGMHYDEDQKAHDVREIDFAQSVLDVVPPGLVYRRGDTVGELVGSPGSLTYRQLTPAAARNLLSAHCRLWTTGLKKENNEYFERWEAMTGDRATLVIDAALRHPAVRDLVRLTSYPVFTGKDLRLAVPGWNGDSGTYVDLFLEGQT